MSAESDKREREHVMTDTPVREAIAEAMPSESVETKVETPAQVETPVTPEPDKTPEQPQEEVQKFAEDVDLTGLTPEQLLETKKEWERKYTHKRQQETAELKAMREELEALKASKPQAPAQQQEASQLPTREQVIQAFKQGQINGQQYQDYMSEIAREEARQVAREEFETLQAQQLEKLEQEYQEQHLQVFVSADPRLAENTPEEDPALRNEVQAKLADKLDKYMSENGTSKGFDASGLTKQFVQEYDKRIDELVKTRTQQSVQAARMRDAKMKKAEIRGTNAPSVSTSGNSLRSILEESMVS